MGKGYPKTQKKNITETIFGKKIQDPYRWLEDDYAEETKIWVAEQQKFTNNILNQYPQRKDVHRRLKEIYDYPRMTVPLKRGDWYYFNRNTGLQNQWVTYRKKTLSDNEELFFDPNSLSEDGTTSAYLSGRSRDDRYFTYNISRAGSDWTEIWIMDTINKEFLPEKLKKVKFSGTSWDKEGFYYSRYDQELDSQEQNKNHKVYYHRLGERQEDDRLIYEDSENPLRYNSAYVSDNQKYLFIYSSQGTYGNQILFKKLDAPNSRIKTLLKGFSNDYSIIDSYEDDQFYVFTDYNAPNNRLFKINLENPEEENWEEIIPERDCLLESVAVVGKKIIAVYMKDVQSLIEVMDLDGNYLYKVEMPYIGIANVVYSKKEDRACYFYFSSFTRPQEAYHYDIEKNKLKFFYHDPLKVDLDQFTSEQVFFTSKDGTRVSMFLNYKKGLKRNGDNPVCLYGYGGFGVSLTPSLNLPVLPFLEKNGIYAVVNLRGGSEYGETWHKAGMLQNKQNVFDDFISAAEYLVDKKYTNPEKVGIEGGSNGGLLVGACMTQRPDLFKVAVPIVGVMDMLRYHKFTCGWGWMVEYGNPEEEEHFFNLLKYSPVHNVKEGVKYPHTMVVTADHDNRVVPGHSFKYAAVLQEKASPQTYQLMYTQIQSGHGSSNLNKGLEMQADILTFMFKFLEM